jgi:hypothetical protein
MAKSEMASISDLEADILDLRFVQHLWNTGCETEWTEFPGPNIRVDDKCRYRHSSLHTASE